MERKHILTILGVVLGVTLIIVISVFGYKYKKRKEPPEICNTDVCQKSAKSLLNSLDVSVYPCVDFFKFACGGWIKNHSTDLMTLQTPLYEIKFKYYERIQEYLNESVTENSPKHLKMAKTQLITCEKQLNSDKDIYGYMKKALKKWSRWPEKTNEQWSEANISFTDILISMAEMGLTRSCLFHTKVIFDNENSSRNDILLEKPKFVFSVPELYSGISTQEIRNSYYTKTISMLKSLHFNISEKSIENDILKIFKFESNLFRISKNVKYREITIEKLERLLPPVNWKKYFREVTKIRFHDMDTIFVFNAKFFLNLFRLFKETPVRTIVNYLTLRAASESFFDTTGDPSTCVKKLFKYLYITFVSAYTKTLNFSYDSSQLVHYIRKSTIRRLRNITWMSPKVRRYAMKKINKTIAVFPFVSQLLNDKILDNYYANLNFRNKNLCVNFINLRKWQMNLEFQRLRKLNDRDDWTLMVKRSFNLTHYFNFFNSIGVELAMLEEPFYNKDRPNYMNYGAVGFMIGHEFMHAIMGHKYDENGNYRLWWDDNTHKLYEKPKQRLINQYNDYTYLNTSLHINGELTVMENVADNGGIKLAYTAYLEWEKEHGAEGTLPGVRYTGKQIFWISAAQIMCATYDVRLANYYLTKTRSPDMIRIRGAFSNMKEFATDFGCHLGYPMNPERKCEVI